MASVCGSTLALMDAGVPIIRPVAGIAMGLVKEKRRLRRAHRHRRGRRPPGRHGLQGRRHRQRHHRPADGHQDQGRDLRRSCAMPWSRRGRPGCSILDKMARVSQRSARRSFPSSRRASPPSASIPRRSGRSSARAARPSAAWKPSSSAPSRSTTTGWSRSSPPTASLGDAVHRAHRPAHPARPEPGDIIVGRVASTTNFGAFVTLKPGTDGLVHISKLGASPVEYRRGSGQQGRPGQVEVLDVQPCRAAKRRSASGCSRSM